MANTPELDAEALHATQMLRGKIVKRVWRHRPGEVGIEFQDGVRLFIDCSSEPEISITGTQVDEHEPA